MDNQQDVFKAIADPTRREILNLVAHKPLSLNSIAENFEMSRPAISQHVKILIESDLVIVKKQGRKRFCVAKPDTLSEVSDWVEQTRKLWKERFQALESFLDELES